MSGRVSSLCGSRSGTGADQRYVPLDQAAYCFLYIAYRVVCCLPVCAQGSSAAVTGNVGSGAFWAFWVLLGVSCIWVGACFACLSPHVYRTRVTEVCLSLDTPIGRRSVGHSLHDPRGVHWFAPKCARFPQGGGSDPPCVVPYMLALTGQPSHHGSGLRGILEKLQAKVR